jgi:hypothetical protein
MNNRGIKSKELAAILEEVKIYLKTHILYSKDLDDITDSILKDVIEMQDLLSRSQNSADIFRQFQHHSNIFKTSIIISVHYPKEDNETIQLMRKLVDAITIYNSSCAPDSPKSNLWSSLFTSSDTESDSEDELQLISKFLNSI